MCTFALPGIDSELDASNDSSMMEATYQYMCTFVLSGLDSEIDASNDSSMMEADELQLQAIESDESL